IGASTAACTVFSIALRSSASSTSGMPALTSSMLAPAWTWLTASSVTVDSSPARSSSANVLRPVGLIRSPMMQNGCSAPIVTLAPRDRSTVSIGLPFDSWCDPQSPAQLGDAGVLAERDEVKSGDAGLGEGMGGELVRDVEALGLRVGGPFDARDGGRRHVDPGHSGGDEPHPADGPQDADRRDHRDPLGEAGFVRLAHEALEQLGPVAELELQETRPGERLLGRAADAVIHRRGARVLDRADEEVGGGGEPPPR